MKKQPKIPGIAHALFKWYCSTDRYEELHGDLEEFYYERWEENGAFRARLGYVMDVIRCCQPYAWKKRKSQNSNIIMFNNYFKTSWRSLMKNPMSSFINLFGLSVAIGICLVVYAFMDFDYSVDGFHKYKDEVYLTTIMVDRDGTIQENGRSPEPLGKMLEQDFPQIKNVCRIKDRDVIVKRDENVFYERVRYADPQFLEMFTFPLKWGARQSLNDLSSVILSEEMAIKYFGGENPVGDKISIIMEGKGRQTFTVAGVAEAFPKAHVIDFGFLLNFEGYKSYEPNYNVNDWGQFVDATFIQVPERADLEAVRSGMDKYKKLQNEVEQDWAIASFEFQVLNGLHHASANIRDGISYDASGPGRLFLPILGIFMLALASLNYINMAIVSASKRLKEIGLRKVMGANRSRVITQFLLENILTTFFALLFGVILGAMVFLPWFVELSGRNLFLKPFDPNLWIFLVTLMFFTGITSGIYPAFYISKFQAVSIFRGAVKFGDKGLLTKVFLSFQLVLACVLIASAVMFAQNTIYQNEQSWGYGYEDALYLRVPGGDAFDLLKASMMQEPNVKSISGSGHHIGRNVAKSIIHLPDRPFEVQQLKVDANYLKTMDLNLDEGRFFKPDHEADKRTAVVNELLVENLEMEEPIGQVFRIDSMRYEIIGVVKNYHHRSFSYSIKPTVFTVANPEDMRYLSLSVKPGTGKTTYEALQKQWAGLFPERPFEGGYQEDVWNGYFEQIANWERFNKAVAIIAVLLAGLGLYGLVTLNISGRIREFSIRKVLGASINHLCINIVKRYLVLTLIALLVGAPLSYLYVDSQFDSVFVYPMPMSYSGVAFAVILLITVLVTVFATQIVKVSKSNPVNGLRVE